MMNKLYVPVNWRQIPIALKTQQMEINECNHPEDNNQVTLELASKMQCCQKVKARFRNPPKSESTWMSCFPVLMKRITKPSNADALVALLAEKLAARARENVVVYPFPNAFHSSFDGWERGQNNHNTSRVDFPESAYDDIAVAFTVDIHVAKQGAGPTFALDLLRSGLPHPFDSLR